MIDQLWPIWIMRHPAIALGLWPRTHYIHDLV